MKPPFSRRDFLKLTGLLSASTILPVYVLKPRAGSSTMSGPNVLIIVFDAWSAKNMSLYGYPRNTTPNLDRLAEKAIVYHNHFSGGNFTTPGTASLLTGTLPWSHRAFILNDKVHRSFADKSLFHAFEGYHRIAYTHNPIANTLLRQFMTAVNQYIPMRDLYLESDLLVNTLLVEDHDIAVVSWNRALKQVDDGYSYSLYLSHLYDGLTKKSVGRLAGIEKNFPRGIPNYDGISYFTLERGIDGVLEMLRDVSQPYLGYYHFLPPHNPFKTRVDFNNRYANDNYVPPVKPESPFIRDETDSRILHKRRLYDEFILYVDYEFARLYETMESAGLLENTWLVLTSDHGEMFERGILGHMTPSLHQPVIQIPLVLFPPGGKTRVDVSGPTSAIDLLPTLMHITGQDIPEWAEGVVLPPFSASISNRDVFALQVEDTNTDGRISSATLMLARDRYKFIWYFGYGELGEKGELVELYDILADPEELRNLAPSQPDLVNELLGIAKSKLAEMDRA